ncbi:MAG: response regulator transcription factor [Chitinophagaceae bacterium]|nr:MAG: response regulator transcription factor [Chitinophagaceae bacterium]
MKKRDIKIAIADDHALVRSGLANMISSTTGFEVVLEAKDGKELMDKLDKAERLPDVILLDISMPVMNGYDTMTAIREKYPSQKVIGLSMYDNELSIIRMFRLGVRGYVEKGSSYKELERALIAVYNGSFYHGEELSARILERMQQGLPPMDINDKEKEFLTLCCSELNYKEIAERMNLSERTIHGYRDALFEKLGLKSRSGLVVFALQTGVVTEKVL